MPDCGDGARGAGADGAFNPDEWFDPKEQRKVDDFIIYAACAATSLVGRRMESRHRRKAGIDSVLIGSGIGGLGGSTRPPSR